MPPKKTPNRLVRSTVLLALVIFPVLGGCSSPATPESLAGMWQRLREDERMCATILLSGFDLKEPGEVVVSMEDGRSTVRVLRYVNGRSPALRFVTKSTTKDLFLGSVFSIAKPEYFYPGYAYVYVDYLSTFNGRGFCYGHIMRKDGDEWILVQTYVMDPFESLDLKAYVEKEIQANKAVDPTSGDAPRNPGGAIAN